MKDYMKIGLIAMMSYTALGQEESLKFNGKLMEPYRMGEYMPLDKNKDMIPDHILAIYDLNGNGIPDVGALFHINSFSYKKGVQVYSCNTFAERVGFDYNEDGKVDAWYADTTGLGLLEKVVLDKEIKLQKS